MSLSSPETWISLDRRPGETLRHALRRTLCDAIRSGALRPGVRLPASRVLAAHLGVSRGVVSDAYEQLRSERFLEVQGRSAPVVAGLRVQGRPGVSDQSRARPRYDLAPAVPDAELFPSKQWLGAYEAAVRGDAAVGWNPPDPCGEPILRIELADYLGRTRGVIADPELIIITPSSARGVELLLAALARRGVRSVAVEDPSHMERREQIRAAGLRVVPQPVDAEGVVVDGLEADALLVTSAHQFPTGLQLSEDRRREVVRWAHCTGAWLLEQGSGSELSGGATPGRALQHQAPGRVVHLGATCHTLAPLISLGWMTVPRSLVRDVHDVLASAEASGRLEQLALARLISTGDYDRHLRRARAVYRRRRDALVTALNDQLLDLGLRFDLVGTDAVIHLPPQADDQAIARAATRARLRVAALSTFYASSASPKGLVVGSARLRVPTAAAAVSLLCRIIAPHL
ncbi:PLP-dependent aminotransferase family protein [Antribacter gilvus]|uniref:aminotransferase-like domain-containing protein n=1 Tax=Antribacter gilvus TaxID=2304675 RepID=UPI0013E06E8D|nr:PLP-dependent aminotransferase family protein [Antribacter gilvus]